VQQELDRPLYTRGYNPTVAMLRKKIAALEHAEDALVFSSGSAAIAAAVISFVKAGDHIVCVHKPYSWTKKLLAELLPALRRGAHVRGRHRRGELPESDPPNTTSSSLKARTRSPSNCRT
jgi:cystathionine beta-lyase/cystathionine gamma-synthase